MFTGGASLRIPASKLASDLGLLAAADAVVFVGAAHFQTMWKRKLKTAGQGRYYEAGLSFVTLGSPARVIPTYGATGARTRGHRAAAPGDPPASDTGHLANAVDIERRGYAEAAVGMGGRTGRIGLTQEYGLNVPGSKVGSHPGGIQIPPHPHGRPALEEALPGMRIAAEHAAREAR